jgi:hypothetical protein
MKLEANEFIRRFLLHIVPNGFMRIRYYGFLANRFRKEKLELCRQLLGADPVEAIEATEVVGGPASDAPTKATSQEHRCPKCEQGVMEIVERLPRQRRAQPGSSHSRSPPLARIA